MHAGDLKWAKRDRKFLRDNCRAAFEYSLSGDLGDDGNVGVNMMVSKDGSVTACTAAALDGNQFVRNMPPHAGASNPTGESVLVVFLQQTLRRTAGFKKRFLVFDVGGDPLKKIEKVARDKTVYNNNNKRYTWM